MDIFDFTQALWRQRKMLIFGFIALMAGIFFLVFEVGEDGIQQRVTPKYVAQVMMAVVSTELESLTDISGVSNFSSIADLYAELLRAPEALRQIQEDQDVTFVEPMEVGGSSGSSFINVSVTADTPEGAQRGALGAFYWLEDRLTQPPNLADIPVEGLDLTEVLDEEGKFLGQVRLSFDRQFIADDMFLVITNSLGDAAAVPMGAIVGVSVHQAYLVPGSPLEISIENEQGVRLDAATLDVPALPEGPLTEIPSLALTLDAGAIRAETAPAPGEEAEAPDSDDAVVTGEVVGADIDASRISVLWDTTPVLEHAPPLTLLLITEEPVPILTGQRRTPIIALAGFGVGLLLLLVSAVTIDTWQQAYAEHGRRRRPTDDEWLETLQKVPDEGDKSDEANVPLSEETVTRFRRRGGVAHIARESAVEKNEDR